MGAQSQKLDGHKIVVDKDNLYMDCTRNKNQTKRNGTGKTEYRQLF